MTPRELVATIAAIAEAVRDLKEVPSGTLYAHLCGKLDISAYESALGVLTRARLIEVKSHLIRWVGP